MLFWHHFDKYWTYLVLLFYYIPLYCSQVQAVSITWLKSTASPTYFYFHHLLNQHVWLFCRGAVQCDETDRTASSSYLHLQPWKHMKQESACQRGTDSAKCQRKPHGGAAHLHVIWQCSHLLFEISFPPSLTNQPSACVWSDIECDVCVWVR